MGRRTPFSSTGILTFVFLGLANAAGRMLSGRISGWIGVVLFAGLPLLGQCNATGGGFELRNIVMILATLLLGRGSSPGATTTRSPHSCSRRSLMAQVRYESPIFLVPVAGIVLWVWYREGRAILPLQVVLVPVLMIHCALHNRIFDTRASSWQLQSKPGYTRPFSLSYIPDNVAHAIGFFFNTRTTDQPNSLVLSSLGAVAILFLLLLVVKRLKTLPTEPPISVATIFFTVGFAAQLGLMDVLFLGAFRRPR